MPSIYYKQQAYAKAQENNFLFKPALQFTRPNNPTHTARHPSVQRKPFYTTPHTVYSTWYVSIFWPYVWLAKCWPSIVTLLLVAHVVLKSSFVTFALEVFRYALCKCSSVRLTLSDEQRSTNPCDNDSCKVATLAHSGRFHFFSSIRVIQLCTWRSLLKTNWLCR